MTAAERGTSPSNDRQSPNPAGMPSDYETLQGVLRGLADDGWDGEADSVEGGVIRWRSCRHEAPASSAEVHALRRMEGASDPADMLAVAAVRCPTCGARAVLVLHYGPTADAADSDVLLELPI